MPIFIKDDIKVLYIHIPKTGGTYVEDFFKSNGFRMYMWNGSNPGGLMKCTPQHYHLNMLKSVTRLGKFDYIFTTVRNPINRFISEFNMNNASSNKEINSWGINALNKYKKNNFILDNHLRPQEDFWSEGIDFYKQEDRFDSAWAEMMSGKIKSKLDIKEVISRRDSSSLEKLILEKELKNKILELYKNDFRLFSYEYD